MNGVHDMGGRPGFGPVVREENEPVFHAKWERRAFALTLAMGAWRRWNLDVARAWRERMPPADYLRASYYERWLWALERLLVEKGFVMLAELDRRPDRPDRRRVRPGRVGGRVDQPTGGEGPDAGIRRNATLYHMIYCT